MAKAYGEETGKVMTYFTSLYGPPPKANLTVVETEDGTPNGYSAPGMLFLSPKGIGDQVGRRGCWPTRSPGSGGATLVSPATRNHMWLENGNARYAEMLYLEHANGPAALEQEIHDTYVEALTVDNPPVIQAGRLEDYSPEYWAVTASKGAADAEHAARVIGDEAFFKLLQDFPGQNGWKSGHHRGFRKAAEADLRAESAVLLHPVDRIERRAGVQDGVHRVPHAEGLPRDGQDLAGSGHLPHAGGPEDRDRRQSRREARGGGGHVVGVHGGHVRQAEDR